MGQKVRQVALKALMSLVLTVVLLECVGAVAIYSNRIPARPPSYKMPVARPPYAVDINPHFGAWHMPSYESEHNRACFSVIYRTNSYGALDIERPKQAEGSRTIVLGDSFTVGHGVWAKERYSDRLEQLTGIPHLNFGAGGTYPLQYFLTYKHLARGFTHDRVIVGILPDNDFNEEPDGERFRPYWEGEYPNYTLRYDPPRVEDSRRHPSRFKGEITAHDVLGSISFFYNVADWIAGYRKVLHRVPDAPNRAGYFDFDDKKLVRMRYSLEQLYALVPEGRLTVMAMPRLIDLERFKAEGKNPFGDKMTPIAREVGFDFIDMLPLMAKAYAGRERELYLPCDGHWSPEGHDFVAKTLLARMYPSLAGGKP